MAINKKTLKNNIKLSNNISRMSNLFVGNRALVLDSALSGLEDISIKDYYHLVILETDDALDSVPVPDYIFITDESPYRNSMLFIESFFDNPDSIMVTNYDMIQVYKKLKRAMRTLNINYLPAPSGTSAAIPATVSFSECGLDCSEPGVHLAKVLGCSEIYYTGSSANATTVGLSDITAFVAEKDPTQAYIPKNFIATNRQTVLNTSF